MIVNMKNNTLGQEPNYFTLHKPESIEDLKLLIESFRETQESYYVVSTGNNWGYGCDHPHNTSTHCINLKNMCRINSYDSYHGLVTLQPGVTYGQLSQFLTESGDEWLTPVHGGGPDCSVIGNVMERGYGLTPIADHFKACQSMEVLLPNGEIYNSPFKSLGLDHLSKLFRYGVGPYLDGIFTQSNFGIVTEMTIKLAPKPKEIELFFMDINDDEIPNAVQIIKQLKKNLGDSIGGINLMNKERLLSMLINYPTDKISSRDALSDDFIKQQVSKHMVADWTLVGAIYGQKEMVKSVKKVIKKEAKIIKGKKVFLNQSKVHFITKLAQRVPKILGFDLKSKADSLNGLLNILNGVPQNTALKLAYWKNLTKPTKVNLNPNRDNCGLIWYAPLVEMKKNSVLEYIELLKRVSKKYNINPLITLTTVDDLCFDSTVPILFNRDDLKDQDRAHAYFNELLEQGKLKGFYPYRLGTNSMPSFLDDLDPEYKKILSDLKNHFDPENRFAKNRYCPSEDQNSSKVPKPKFFLTPGTS